MNCWEYMRCGRQPGGAAAKTEGVCPAATDCSFDGVNGGKNAGRFCWAVTGTRCSDGVQGCFSQKRAACTKCLFYQRVHSEAGTRNLRTILSRFFTPTGSLLKAAKRHRIPKGKRFILQGDRGDTAYVIQHGTCIKLVEKNGQLHPCGHYSEGDMVGIISMLTGEPHHAHVEAETDLEVRVIETRHFNAITKDNPDLHEFLTELVADRFDSNRPTASRTIDRYMTTEIIGRGGYSIVYRGIRIDDDHPVAIKMLRHHMALRTDFLANFRKEANIIAGLRHRNIIRVYDMLERFRTAFIIMEDLQGESVAQTIAKTGCIPPDKTLFFLRQVCAALVHAHEQGVIHRDLNPSNIMVVADDRAKLIDFGLACSAGTDDYEFGGAMAYQAPELLEGDPADVSSDIYALGISAFEMATGQIPHAPSQTRTFIQRRITEAIPDPKTLMPNISEPLRLFILKACHQNPQGRYGTAATALQALTGQGER